jgi:hypothetical protein
MLRNNKNLMIMVLNKVRLLMRRKSAREGGGDVISLPKGRGEG